MSIIFAGGELQDFDTIGSPVHQTSPANRDTNYARISINTQGGSNAAITKDFPSTTDVMVKAHAWVNTATQDGRTGMLLKSSIGNVARMAGTGSSFEMKLQRWDGAAWQDVDTMAYASEVESYAIHVKTAEQGFIRFYKGGALQAEWLGNTTALGEVNHLLLSSISNSASNYTRWSEVIVASHDVRSARLKTLAITGAGAETDWSGAHTDINAYDTTDDSFISSEAVDEISTYAVGTLFDDSLEVDAVVVAGRFRRNLSGPENIDVIVRHDGNNYGQSLGDLLNNFESRQKIFAVNPATAAQWARADVDALQIGVESKE